MVDNLLNFLRDNWGELRMAVVQFGFVSGGVAAARGGDAE